MSWAEAEDPVGLRRAQEAPRAELEVAVAAAAAAVPVAAGSAVPAAAEPAAAPAAAVPVAQVGTWWQWDQRERGKGSVKLDY